MRRWARRGWWLVALVLIGAGCREDRQRIGRVPSHQGSGTCTIKVKELHDNVLLRCGPPCGTGAVADGLCPGGTRGCDNRCDIYQDVEVCYANDRVVTLARIDREYGRFPWCFWPEMAVDPSRAQRAAAAGVAGGAGGGADAGGEAGQPAGQGP